MYTIETLKEINQSYDAEHILTQEDVNMANVYVALIEQSRSKWGVKVGDIVETLSGDNFAHVEEVENEYLNHGNVSVCRGAYTPFIGAHLNDSNIKIKTNTSGGPWESIPAMSLELQPEKKLKSFVFFGHSGMRGNGGVKFQALVNVWKEAIIKQDDETLALK